MLGNDPRIPSEHQASSSTHHNMTQRFCLSTRLNIGNKEHANVESIAGYIVGDERGFGRGAHLGRRQDDIVGEIKH